MPCREVKDLQYLPEKLSLKSSKELYEYCQRAEQDYRPLITGTGQRLKPRRSLL